MKIDKFAWVGHLMETKDIYNFTPSLNILKPFIRKMPNSLFEKICKSLPPYKFLDFKLTSKTNKTVSGLGILFPLSMRQMIIFEEELIIKKVIMACKLAQRLGARMVTLGGAASMVGNEGLEIAKNLDIPITSAKNYIASLAISGIFKACEMLRIDIKNSSIAIIGATSSLGSACLRILLKYFGQILLSEKIDDKNKVSELVQDDKDKSANIIFKKYAFEITKEADVILAPIFYPGLDFNINELKPGTILCDAVAPFYIGREVRRQRNDVLAFEAPWCKLPANSKIKNEKFNRLQPNGVIYACVGEGVILSMEGKFENFSLGRENITPEKVSEISKIASKHDFRLPDLRCNDYVYTKDDVDTFRKLREMYILNKKQTIVV